MNTRLISAAILSVGAMPPTPTEPNSSCDMDKLLFSNCYDPPPSRHRGYSNPPRLKKQIKTRAKNKMAKASRRRNRK